MNALRKSICVEDDSYLSFLSPAKVNLFFRVLYKREDGFHEIASLYQAISLFDTLYFKKSGSPRLTCTDPTLACDETNLVAKAEHLFRKHTGITEPVHIHLRKKIPMQAGLGGGSSNAATALFGLNRLFGEPVTESDLCEWAKTLGSDVAFFLSSGTAYCTGRGEKIEELQHPLPELHFSLAKPVGGLSTPLVYRHCDVARLSSVDPASTLEGFLMGDPHYYNDLEQSAFSLMPSLREVKEALLVSGFSHVVLCGSGSAFFCLGTSKEKISLPLQFFTGKSVQRRYGRWYE